jgi:hypothetical protein
MKKVYITMLAAGSAALMMTGCASSKAAAPVEEVKAEPAIIVPGAIVTENGAIVFSAAGQSVCLTESPLSVAKAEVAATTVAKANLLEVVKGALVSSNAKVKDLVLTSQTAEKTVNGWLARATVEIVPLKAIVVEKTNLPTKQDTGPKEQMVTAIATLTLSAEDMDALKPYVE